MGAVMYVLDCETPEGNLEKLWEFLVDAYQELGSETKFSRLKMSMFRTKSQPTLKGKAAEVKDLGPALLLACYHFLNPRVGVHQMIVAVLEGSGFTLRVFFSL